MKTKKRLKSSGLITFLFSIIIIGICGLVSYKLLGIELCAVFTGLLAVLLFIGYLLDRPKSKTKKRRTLKILLAIFMTLFLLVLCAVIAFGYYIVKQAPDFEASLLKEKEATVLYDIDGNEYAKLGAQIRENIEYDQISEVFIDALIATEDSRFYQHNGFDIARFLKASIGQVLGKSDAGGGSTLTMQVSKNQFTSTDDTGFKGIVRKFTDIYMAIFQIEKKYTKEEIIEFYVNNHYMGGQAWGLYSASHYYFDKEPCELNLAEASLLAGIFKAPQTYNPYRNPENAEARRATVLNLMVRHGYITKEEADAAKAIPIESLLVSQSTTQSEYQGYIDLVAAEVKERYGVDIYSTSMEIYTNMETTKQDGINDILNGKTFKWKDDKLQTGIAVVNTQNGKIRAIGAGRNRTGEKTFNYATDINRQIGSTAKPLFDYGPGIEYNNWSTAKIFNDEAYNYSNGKAIHNYDNKYAGYVTLRYALQDSRNIPALKAFQQTDNKKIIELVTTVGITPEISDGYIHEAHSIGAFTGSNPLTMAGAYMIFSNGGYYYKPYSVSKVVFKETGETDEYSSKKIQVISAATSYMIADILKDLPSSARTGSDVTGIKTGTTNVDSALKTSKKLPSSIVRDYWIIGFTYNTSIAVWLGYDELDSKYYLSSSTDSKLRQTLLKAVSKVCFDHTGKGFTQPNTVVRVTIEKPINDTEEIKLPSEYTPESQKLTELFKRGTEPTEVSTRYYPSSTPSNFNVQVSSSQTYATLTWDAVANPGYQTDVEFGYYVYYGEELVDFTTNTSYTISNKTTYLTTYSVVAGYKDSEYNRSAAATYEYSSYYKLSLKNHVKTYKVGESISSSIYDGSVVVLKHIDSTVEPIIKITITDKDGNTVTKLNTDTVNTYTIVYEVSYSSYTNKITDTITVTE